MTTSGFYKLEGSELIYAPNWVIAPNFELLRSAKDSYTYPVNDWYWFDSVEMACQFFIIPVPENFNQGTVFTPSEGSPNWDGFNAAMLADTAFNQTTGYLLTVAPAVAIAIPTALAQVSTNGTTAFSIVFNSFCQYGNISSQQREVWAGLAESFNLPIEFIGVIRS